MQIQVWSGVSECRFQAAGPGSPKAVLLMEATTHTEGPIEAHSREQQREGQQRHRHEIEEDERQHRIRGPFRHGPAADAHGRHGARMHQELQLPPGLAREHQRAEHLDAAAGDPVLQTMPERNSIQMGANTGQVVSPWDRPSPSRSWSPTTPR